MISICLKSTNKIHLNYIAQKFEDVTLPEIYYSQKRFKIYNNFIIHYLGINKNEFYNIFFNILSSFIIDNFENLFISRLLNFDYFYFSNIEKNHIKENTINIMNNSENANQKKHILYNTLKFYFSNNSICILDGFINFRLYDYKNFINQILEKAINDYVLKKEYIEYVDLLSEYINLQDSQSSAIHLIYTDSTKILLDDSNNIITNTR